MTEQLSRFRQLSGSWIRNVAGGSSRSRKHWTLYADHHILISSQIVVLIASAKLFAASQKTLVRARVVVRAILTLQVRSHPNYRQRWLPGTDPEYASAVNKT